MATRAKKQFNKRINKKREQKKDKIHKGNLLGRLLENSPESTDKMAGNKHLANGLLRNLVLYNALISLATGLHQSVHQTKGKISSSTGNRTKKHTK